MHIIKIGNKCCNVDNDADMQLLLDAGGVLLTLGEIEAAGMIGYENLVGPGNTAVGEDGNVTFAPPAPTLEDQLAAIEEKYGQKQAELDKALVAALRMDGTQEATARASIRQKSVKLIQDQNNEIDALFAAQQNGG